MIPFFYEDRMLWQEEDLPQGVLAPGEEEELTDAEVAQLLVGTDALQAIAEARARAPSPMEAVEAEAREMIGRGGLLGPGEGEPVPRAPGALEPLVGAAEALLGEGAEPIPGLQRTVTAGERGLPAAEGLTAEAQLAAEQRRPAGRFGVPEEIDPERLIRGIEERFIRATIPGEEAERPRGPGDDLRIELERRFPVTPTAEAAAAAQRVAAVGMANLLNDAAAEYEFANGTAQELDRFADLVEKDPMRAQEALEGMRRQRNRVTSDVEALIRTAGSTRIDPARFFHSRGAAASFGAALSVAAGAVASTLVGGENAALQIIERAIDRDVRAQEFDAENRRATAQAGLGLIDRIRSAMRDDLAAAETLRELRFANAEGRIRAMEARSISDVQRGALANLRLTLADRRTVANDNARRALTSILLKGNLRRAEQLSSARFQQLSRGAEQLAAGLTPRPPTAEPQLRAGPGGQPITRRAVRGPTAARPAAPGQPRPVEIGPGGRLPPGTQLTEQGTVVTTEGEFTVNQRTGRVSGTPNTVFIRGLGGFDLQPDSSIRILPTARPAQVARVLERREGYLGATQAAIALWRQAIAVSRIVAQVGPFDRVSNLGDRDQAVVESAINDLADAGIRVRQASLDSGVLNDGERIAFEERTGLPDLPRQIIAYFSADERGVIEERLRSNTRSAIRMLIDVSRRFGVNIPETELEQFENVLISRSR